MMMAIVKDKIETHIKNTNQVIDTQSGFIQGSRLEDNLFVLKYCITNSYKEKKPLIITAIDFKKAFDSIKREKLIEALMHFKFIHK